MSPLDESEQPNDAPAEAGRFERLLAVSYVLAPVVGAAGFFLLAGAATVLGSRRGLEDGLVWSLYLGALACPLWAAAFRRCVWYFGRRRWLRNGEDASSASE